jgi:predicted nucleic acid-binding protein
MAGILVDTNVLLRAAHPASPLHPVCTRAFAKLLGDNHTVWLAPQTIVEFWVVATRPADVNGLGWTTADAGAQIAV